MNSKTAIVVTTINHPTRAVVALADGAKAAGATFYVIGDRKSPPDFNLPACTYMRLEDQLRSGFKFAENAPVGHYARKNVGYLAAMREGAEIIVETDDDNFPEAAFWEERERQVFGRHMKAAGWINAYAFFSDAHIWPRGLPLDQIRSTPVQVHERKAVDCPIQQGLADDNPDVDAIYRLVMPLPIKFEKREPLILGPKAWCPFNSQNTTWWKPTFPLLYLPSFCSFRMTDIWRSFISQRISWENGWSIMFHSSTVFQERNEHSLVRDFEDEIPGYLNNERIKDALERLHLEPGAGAIPANLMKCYKALVEGGWIGGDEIALLQDWLDDCEKV